MSHKERFTRENLQPRTLDLVRVYYPSPRREKILLCCERQLANPNDKRTCRDALCPNCCPRESYKIARTQYARFLAHTPAHKPNPRVAHEVYTLPPYLRPYVLTKEGFQAWRDATLETIREIHQAEVAGVMNLHPIGDDLTVFHPHWDVVVSGYVLDGERPREHRAPHLHYDDARAIYRRNLAKHLGLQGELIPRRLSVYLDRKDGTFHTSARRAWHRIRYSARHVYQPQFAWLNDGGTQGDWWYKPERRMTRPFAFEGSAVIANFAMIEQWLQHAKRRVWFGHLHNRVGRKTAAFFGRKPTGEKLA